MIANGKHYRALKDTGVEWLGEVPAHWEVRRLKDLLRPVDRRSTTGRETLLALRRDHGVVPYAAHFSHPSQSQSLVGFKLVNVNQLVVNRLQANNGLVFCSGLSGLVSPDYSVFERRVPLDVGFLSSVLRTPLYRTRFRRESTGLGTGTAGFLRLYDDRFLATHTVLPPVREQKAIVRFINHVDEKVWQYIRAEEKLLALLEEQKQVVIHQAVTGRVDVRTGQRYPAYKDSGITWLGHLPRHWDVRRVGGFSRVGNGSTPSRSNPEFWSGGTHPWLNSSSVNQGTIKTSEQLVTDTALRKCHLPRVPTGSVLVGITGQGRTRGMVALLAIEATINQHMAYITPSGDNGILPRYLWMYLRAAYLELRAISSASGSTKAALTCDDIKAFAVALPPVNEQHALIETVETAFRNRDRRASLARRQIDCAQEYRTRLIADAVTGKLDVREEAAELPDVASAAARNALDEVGDAGALSESSDVNQRQAEVEQTDA